jgi:hypothetical protein
VNIEQIFAKPLKRDINGVVKAEQLDNDCVFIELDEYVMTTELDRHFRQIPFHQNLVLFTGKPFG